MLFNLKVNSDVKLSAKNVDASGTNTHMLHMYMLYKSKKNYAAVSNYCNS